MIPGGKRECLNEIFFITPRYPAPWGPAIGFNVTTPSKEFLEVGKKRLAGERAREATSDEVKGLQREAGARAVRHTSRVNLQPSLEYGQESEVPLP